MAAQNAAVLEARHNVGVAEAAIQQAQAKIPQADASIQSAMTRPQQVSQSESRVKSAAAKVAELQAQLDQAKLNLSYTIIVAPVSGIVGKKTAEIGQNVSPGEQLMAVVPLDDVWVTANFKETQLRKMKPGQKVKFSVDAYDHEYSGHVTGIGGASGSRYSLLPPENATGNYVKVVQRIPVRIDLDPNENKDHRLRPGNVGRSEGVHGAIALATACLKTLKRLPPFPPRARAALDSEIQSLAGRRGRRDGGVHGGARHQHRQCRAAAHSRQPGRE